MTFLTNMIKGIAEGIAGQVLAIALLLGYVIGVMKTVDVVNGRLPVVATGILFTAAYLTLAVAIITLAGHMLDKLKNTCRADSE